MSLASLLKKGSLRGFATATSATPATHGPISPLTVATVARVAVANTPDRAANDPTQSPENLGDLTPQQGGQLSTPAASDPDAYCWPHSDAMTGAELDTFTARLTLFTAKGITPSDGEALADKLVTRDRDSDDRRLCLECTHLAGHAQTFGCRAWRRAGIAIKAQAAGLPVDLVRTLQRCDGFTATH